MRRLILVAVPGVLVGGLGVTLAALAQPPPAPAPPAVKVGEAAPDFTLSYLEAAAAGQRPERKQVKLSDYKGRKNVVLAFFPAAFSPG